MVGVTGMFPTPVAPQHARGGKSIPLQRTLSLVILFLALVTLKQALLLGIWVFLLVFFMVSRVLAGRANL